MNTYQMSLEFVAWGCFAAVAYAYVGYPMLIWLLARIVGRPARPGAEPHDAILPPVTLLIAAHNEETVIADRLENALALNYPRQKLEIVVVADGCTDQTIAIVRYYATRGVRLYELSPRRGKSQALNHAVPLLQGDVVILSDANTHCDPQMARRLARWFSDPQVTAVCGRLVLTDPQTGSNVDSLYWKYETFLKRQESTLGALLGANGAVYAMRRDRFVAVPPNVVVDDLVIPLLAQLHHGGKVLYDETAIAYEETAEKIRTEFHRRSRIGAGGFGSLSLLARLLNPMRGWLAFAFMSHKVLRWFCPFFLLGLLATSALLVELPLYGSLLLLQFGFYAIAVLAACLPGQLLVCKLLRLTTMFTSMNAALLCGFVRWLFKTQGATWRRTQRAAEGRAVQLSPVPSAGNPVLP